MNNSKKYKIVVLVSERHEDISPTAILRAADKVGEYRKVYELDTETGFEIRSLLFSSMPLSRDQVLKLTNAFYFQGKKEEYFEADSFDEILSQVETRSRKKTEQS